MKSSVLIDYSGLTKEDVTYLNENQQFEVEFSKTESHNFLPPDVVLVLIELAKSISFSMANDIIKYILMKLLSLFQQEAHKKTTIAVSCNNQNYSISCNFPLTDEQKDILVNAAAQKLLDKK